MRPLDLIKVYAYDNKGVLEVKLFGQNKPDAWPILITHTITVLEARKLAQSIRQNMPASGWSDKAVLSAHLGFTKHDAFGILFDLIELDREHYKPTDLLWYFRVQSMMKEFVVKSAASLEDNEEWMKIPCITPEADEFYKS